MALNIRGDLLGIIYGRSSRGVGSGERSSPRAVFSFLHIPIVLVYSRGTARELIYSRDTSTRGVRSLPFLGVGGLEVMKSWIYPQLLPGV